MSARKLSDSEKQTILQLYRETSETSSSLATRYGVSTSTVSRLLKSTLPADEYEALIQQKRTLRSADSQPEEPVESAPVPATQPIKQQLDLELDEQPTQPAVEVQAPRRTVEPPIRRSRKRSSVADAAIEATAPAIAPDLDEPEEADPLEEGAAKNPIADEVLKEILRDDLIEAEEDDDDLEDDLEDDDEDDLEDDDDDLDSRMPDRELFVAGHGGRVHVLPLAESAIPRTCYLVVDRSAELIAPPLKDFGDLGQIPEGEVQEKTLPIFDNHRVAKRYSNPRTQRVIKLPDGKVLRKTLSHLQAKGITRVLIDGQVYSI